MFTFFTIVFGLIWAGVSFLLLFQVWDKIGPLVLNVSKNHLVQGAAMVITYLIIWGVPMKLWFKVFG